LLTYPEADLSLWHLVFRLIPIKIQNFSDRQVIKTCSQIVSLFAVFMYFYNSKFWH